LFSLLTEFLKNKFKQRARLMQSARKARHQDRGLQEQSRDAKLPLKNSIATTAVVTSLASENSRPAPFLMIDTLEQIINQTVYCYCTRVHFVRSFQLFLCGNKSLGKDVFFFKEQILN
jgi:hypothetical protein